MAAEKGDDDPEGSALLELPLEAEKGNPEAGIQPLPPEIDACWKAVFHESIQRRTLTLQGQTVEKLHKVKLREKKVEKKEPADGLSREWFNDESTTLETRTYLLEKLLPTLIPGVEKLLQVAERKGALETTEFEPRKLDPINFLGEYLMRHNPSYKNLAMPNPYVRGMKAITDELKTQVPETTMHKLAQMKTLVKEKREQREQVQKIKGDVQDMRRKALATQFKEWTQDVSRRIPLLLIQSALKSFLEVVSSAPADPQTGIYARPLESVGTLSVKVNEEEFVEYLLPYIKNFTSDMFQQLLQHLLQCANNTREAIRRDVWRQMFLQLFFDCDHGKVALHVPPESSTTAIAYQPHFFMRKTVRTPLPFPNTFCRNDSQVQEEKVGLLDRLRIISLLETFYDHSSAISRKNYCEPRKWPITEPDEVEMTEFWGNMEDDGQTDSEQPTPPSLKPALRLSEEALLLNLMLKDVLSDMQVAIPEAAGIPKVSAAASQPETGLEEKVVAAEEGSKVTLATSTQDGAEIPAVELETVGPEAEGQQTPAADEPAVPATEEGAAGEAAANEAAAGNAEEVAGNAEEEAGPEAHPAEQALDSEDAEENAGPEASLAEIAQSLQQALDQELGPDQEAGSEEREILTEEAGADAAAAREQPDGQAEPSSEAAAPGQPGSEVRPCASTERPSATSMRKPPASKGKDLPPSPPATASKTAEGAPQLIYGQRWSGDFQTADLSFKYTDYGKEIREDWNNENTRFPGLRGNMIEMQACGPPSTTSAFEKHSLNLPQFVQLMETFVGEEPSLPNLKRLVEFVREGYVQTEEEKIEQLERVHHQSSLARRQLFLAAVFEKWDNECSGFLDMEEVDAVLSTFKEGMEQEALNKAKRQLPVPQWHPSGVVKLAQKDFQTYIELVASELTGDEDEVLDNIVEFLMMEVERTHTERLRGSARRKWLAGIQRMAMIHGGAMEPVYQAVFKALCRDADAHGDGKKIGAYIALLEYNLLAPERGDVLLRYVACTEDDAPHVLNQTLFMDMEGVSFAAVLDDKPIHVPRVQLHGNIHFWNRGRPKREQQGSFLVLPLEDIRRRVFGILGLDTLRDTNERTIFVPHEIRFYQGVANCFSIAYHNIRTQASIMQVLLTAVGWLLARTSHLQATTVYFMEPGETRMYDYILRKVMASDAHGQAETYPAPAPALSRKDDVFRDYLFKCVDCAMVVPACVYGERHLAVPLRNLTGRAIAVFDFSLRPCEKLPSYEYKDLQGMVKTVHAASCEILKEDAGELDPSYVLGIVAPRKQDSASACGLRDLQTYQKRVGND
ncbi:EF-hand calcium-binding domain-containing protein 5 [Varanus komodoensis]|nr:EF-hand calcium-binding domain-containing protein 5 [Varanus komodoensis]